MLFLYATFLVGDWSKIVSATGGNSAGAITGPAQEYKREPDEYEHDVGDNPHHSAYHKQPDGFIEDDKQRARELLAAGKSELISRPILPIAAEAAFAGIGKTFTRENIAAVKAGRDKLALTSSVVSRTDSETCNP